MDLAIDDKVNHGDLSRLLADKLREHIREKALTPGSRLPSNRDIAQMANVSQVTARMAMKRLEKEGLLECRVGQGAFVRCMPSGNEPRQRIAVRQLGVVLSPWDSREQLAWDNRDLITGLINEFCRVSVQLVIISYQQWLDYARHDPFNMITENNLDILIWIHTGIREAAFIAKLEERGFKQILLNRRTPGLTCPAVLQDEPGMLHDIVARMTPEELDSYLIICGDRNISPYQERYAELEKLLLAANKFRPERIVQLPEAPFPEWTDGIIRDQIARFSPRIVVDFIGYMEKIAIFVTNDKISDPPHFVSVLPPEAWGHKMNFPYSYYTFDLQSAGKYVNQMLNGEVKTLMLPFKYHSSNQQ